MKIQIPFSSLLSVVLLCQGALAITYTPFGPRGAGGVKNGQVLLVGSGGTVHELDGFVRVEGLDLNGAQPGVCAQLSRDSLPTGLDFGFAAALSNNATDLVLTYALTNRTGASLTNVSFFVLLDAEIDEALNTFFNESGTAQGQLGAGSADGNPDQWQIDEPGFKGGSLYSNLVYGALSNSNGIAGANDVALALGFALGTLRPGQSNVVRVMISEASNHLGGFWLTQRDQAPGSSTTITLSGNAMVNEFSVPSQLQFGLSRWSLNLSNCVFRGSVGITNTIGSGPVIGPPYYLGLQPSPEYVYVSASGTLSNGFPYMDLSALVSARVPGGLLFPGQYVFLTNAVQVYSLDGGQQQQGSNCSQDTPPPTNSLFMLQVTRQ